MNMNMNILYMYIWIQIFFHNWEPLMKWIQFGMNMICVKHAGDFKKSAPRRATTPSWRNTGQLRVPHPQNQGPQYTPTSPKKNLKKDFRLKRLTRKKDSRNLEKFKDEFSD